jgi:hypothetical protein
VVGCVRRGEGQSNERTMCGERPGMVDRMHMTDCICLGSSNKIDAPLLSFHIPTRQMKCTLQSSHEKNIVERASWNHITRTTRPSYVSTTVLRTTYTKEQI